MFRLLISAAALFVASPAAAGDWQHQAIHDHLKGKIGIGAMVGGMLEGAERGRHLGFLRVYCADNSTIVNVESDKFFFGSSPVSVRYSIDGGSVQSAQWNNCQDSRCVGLWGGQGIPFVKSLFGKRELKMVIELRFTAPINATFHIDGAEAALSEVGETCGWMPKKPAGK